MNATLLILAAGAGSRYGRLKQLDDMGPNGEALFEYSIYDAIVAGFKQVVFVINREIDKQFRAFVQDKFSAKIKVDFAYQELNSCIENVSYASERVKPWGTGHAVLTAEHLIRGPFLMINADDFYGREAYELAARSFAEKEDFFIIGYPVGNTLSDHGTVNRAELETDPEGNLIAIAERLHIQIEKGILYYEDAGEKKELPGPETPISMNIMGFPHWVFAELRRHFASFLSKNAYDLRAEFLMPNIVNEILADKAPLVKVLKTNAAWFGVTFPADKAKTQKQLLKLVNKGLYPDKLWQ